MQGDIYAVVIGPIEFTTEGGQGKATGMVSLLREGTFHVAMEVSADVDLEQSILSAQQKLIEVAVHGLRQAAEVRDADLPKLLEQGNRCLREQWEDDLANGRN